MRNRPLQPALHANWNPSPSVRKVSLCIVLLLSLLSLNVSTHAQTTRDTPRLDAGQASLLYRKLSSSRAASAPLPLKLVVAEVGGIPTSVVLTGVPAKFTEGDSAGSHKLFTVSVAGDDDLPPIVGTYEYTENEVRFTPRFPFEGGLTYVATISANASPDVPRELQFTVAKPRSTAPRVEAILPLTDSLPENVLRFYVKFSAPMAEGELLKHIHLWDDTTGEESTGVFFDNVHELWTTDRRQVTLLVDPGRVKSGLAANRKLGRAFKRGHLYRIVVEPSWSGIQGTPLAGRYEKRFRSVAANNRPVDASKWSLRVTDGSDGRKKLLVDFHEDVDHVSVQTYLAIRDARGIDVTGKWDLEGQFASFRPDNLWSPGAHQLVVNARFEDIVGNNLNGPFEHTVGTLHSENEGWLHSRRFQVPFVDCSTILARRADHDVAGSSANLIVPQ